MAKRWRQDPDVLAEVERLALEDYSSTTIERLMRGEKRFKGRVPSLRTIQAIARAAAPRDPAEWWSAPTAPTEEARAVLPVLGALLEHSGGRRRRIRRRHAAWVGRVVAWVPDCPPSVAYAVGWAYERAEQADASLDALDRYLALRPWRLDPAEQLEAFRSGILDVLVWDPAMAKSIGQLEILSERPDATLLWPFMAAHPIAMLRHGEQRGDRRWQAQVVDAESDEETER